MKCPKCNEEMLFEEVKNFSGIFYCVECDIEIDGVRLPISDGDGNIEYEDME
jgi:hypothetical protein